VHLCQKLLFYVVGLKQVWCTVQVLDGSDSSDGSSRSSSSGESPSVVYVSLIENLLTRGPVSNEDRSHVPLGEVIFTTDYNECNEWRHREHVTGYDEHTTSYCVHRNFKATVWKLRQSDIREFNQCLQISHRDALYGMGANFFRLKRNVLLVC